MEPMVMMWLIGIIVFVVLEAVTYQIVSIWFALGAVGGLIAELAGANFTVQLVVFAVVSAVFLMCLRPFSKRILSYKKEKTNIDSLIGKEVLVTQEVDNLRGTGEGRVEGMTWTIRSADNETIPEHETVNCVKVEGVKLIVTRKEV